jgi:hypothetical protein
MLIIGLIIFFIGMWLFGTWCCIDYFDDFGWFNWRFGKQFYIICLTPISIILMWIPFIMLIFFLIVSPFVWFVEKIYNIKHF